MNIQKLKNLILHFHKKIFARELFSGFNKFLMEMGMNGLGIHNYENMIISGEHHFLRLMSECLDRDQVVLDIGAFHGHYSTFLYDRCDYIEIHAFEPHPKNFDVLKENTDYTDIHLHNVAIDRNDQTNKRKLFDYTQNWGSSHASLQKNVIEDVHDHKSSSIHVPVKSIDQFIDQQGIDHVGFMKIDTEGNEYRVLQGSSKSLCKGIIDVIQFEFNEMHIQSRVFFKDFRKLLDQYKFFRLLPEGLLPLREYQPRSQEIFSYQNIIAINESMEDLLNRL